MIISGPLIQTDGTLNISTEPLIKNLPCFIHSYPELFPGLIYPINYSHLILSIPSILSVVLKQLVWIL